MGDGLVDADAGRPLPVMAGLGRRWLASLVV
jgi:hypothetical protein